VLGVEVGEVPGCERIMDTQTIIMQYGACWERITYWGSGDCLGEKKAQLIQAGRGQSGYGQ
jgi:hypothetical protein